MIPIFIPIVIDSDSEFGFDSLPDEDMNDVWFWTSIWAIVAALVLGGILAWGIFLDILFWQVVIPQMLILIAGITGLTITSIKKLKYRRAKEKL